MLWDRLKWASYKHDDGDDYVFIASNHTTKIYVNPYKKRSKHYDKVYVYQYSPLLIIGWWSYFDLSVAWHKHKHKHKRHVESSTTMSSLIH